MKYKIETCEYVPATSIIPRSWDKWIETCEYVPATSIIPRSWDKWFWEKISNNAPFSWGDNNHSLVAAADFANYCEERLDDSRKVKNWLWEVRKLGNVYIDLEN